MTDMKNLSIIPYTQQHHSNNYTAWYLVPLIIERECRSYLDTGSANRVIADLLSAMKKWDDRTTGIELLFSVDHEKMHLDDDPQCDFADLSFPSFITTLVITFMRQLEVICYSNTFGALYTTMNLEYLYLEVTGVFSPWVYNESGEKGFEREKLFSLGLFREALSRLTKLKTLSLSEVAWPGGGLSGIPSLPIADALIDPRTGRLQVPASLNIINVSIAEMLTKREYETLCKAVITSTDSSVTYFELLDRSAARVVPHYLTLYPPWGSDISRNLQFLSVKQRNGILCETVRDDGQNIFLQPEAKNIIARVNANNEWAIMWMYVSTSTLAHKQEPLHFADGFRTLFDRIIYPFLVGPNAKAFKEKSAYSRFDDYIRRRGGRFDTIKLSCPRQQTRVVYRSKHEGTKRPRVPPVMKNNTTNGTSLMDMD